MKPCSRISKQELKVTQMNKLLVICFFLFLFLHFAKAQETVPENFGCEVRYHFLGFHLHGGMPSYKNYFDENLPPSYLTRDSMNNVVRMVKGSVKNLPYLFIIKITKKSKTDPGMIEVVVIDQSTNKSLNGFPKKVPNPLKPNLQEERTDFQIPFSASLENKIVEFYLAPHGYHVPDGQLTYINLIIGIDKPFLNDIDPLEN